MELTNISGQPFLVNIDSVVYAYERGDGATLLLATGDTLLDVQETPAEVVTASDSVLVAFTALSGDAVGIIAINPDFILTVGSSDGGDSSQIVLCDSNSRTRATMIVDTAYADMNDIIAENAENEAAIILVSRSSADYLEIRVYP